MWCTVVYTNVLQGASTGIVQAVQCVLIVLQCVNLTTYEYSDRVRNYTYFVTMISTQSFVIHDN